MGLGYILGDFFADSSGHPVWDGVVAIVCVTAGVTNGQQNRLCFGSSASRKVEAQKCGND
jgi:hypothetical protein